MRYNNRRRNNTSGHHGVQWCERDQVWMVYLTVNGKRKFFGSFRNKEDAIKRRQDAEAEFPESCRPMLTQPDDPSIKLIALTQGQVAIVDAEDYGRVNARYWNAHWDNAMQSFYAHASSSGTNMHRFILGITDPSIKCDHRDGNTLNNRKSNLRIATSAQNSQNRKPRNDNTSNYTGICLHKHTGKWQANITANKKNIYLGLFDRKEDAIQARKDAEIKYHGEFAFSARQSQPPKKPPVSIKNPTHQLQRTS